MHPLDPHSGTSTPSRSRDRCPHRGARLSAGKVVHGQIACPYHDWRFDAQGRCTKGRSTACRLATAYEARQAHGLIWLRRAGADTHLPDLHAQGYTHTLSRAYEIGAPLVQVLENLVDVEHTGSVHWFLGGGPMDVDDLRFKVEAREHEVWVSSSLRQKPLPAALRAPLGIEPGDRYALRFRAGFSPVHFLYDFVWNAWAGKVADKGSLETLTRRTDGAVEAAPGRRGQWIGRQHGAQYTRVLADLEIQDESEQRRHGFAQPGGATKK